MIKLNPNKGEVMYYNSNKANSDYYNTYKQEMASLEDYHEGFSFQKIIKIGFTILMVGLLSIFTIYLVNYFSTDMKEIRVAKIIKYTQEKEPNKIVFSEEMLPKSIQFQEKRTDISPKDIALIVQIIATQISQKQESSLESQLLSAEDSRINIKTLEESNHYNKVVVADENYEDIVDRQIELKARLDRAVEESSQLFSNYELAIKKEINVRSNEMRVIVVQKGDTLSKIAKKAYGDFDAYPKILVANPEVLKNPNEIFVGQKLRIPA